MTALVTAKDIIQAAQGGDGPLGKAAADEPVFVLRARDMFAPGLVRIWSQLVTMQTPGRLGSDKTEAARTIAVQMEAWQRFNTMKLPD